MESVAGNECGVTGRSDRERRTGSHGYLAGICCLCGGVVCACVWRSEVDIWCLPGLHTIFRGFLAEPGALAARAGQRASGTHLSALPE